MVSRSSSRNFEETPPPMSTKIVQAVLLVTPPDGHGCDLLCCLDDGVDELRRVHGRKATQIDAFGVGAAYVLMAMRLVAAAFEFRRRRLQVAIALQLGAFASRQLQHFLPNMH